MHVNKYKFIQKEISGIKFNELFNDITFVKLTNQDENHNGFKFHDGLNIDKLQFNPIGTCLPGGIYFTDIKLAWNWIHYDNKNMTYMRKVTIPNDARVYIEEDKFKADKIILSPREVIDDEIFIEAVKHNGCMLRYVSESSKTVDLYTIAVKQNGYAIQYIPLEIRNQYNELPMLAIRQNGYALKYIHLEARDKAL